MTRKFRFLMLVTAFILCLGILCGCDKEAPAPETQEGSQSETQNESVPDDVIGKISFLYERYFYVETCKNEGKVPDYTEFNTNTLVYDGYSERVYIDSDAEFYRISDGKQVPASRENLETEQLVAITEDENDVQQIIILK